MEPDKAHNSHEISIALIQKDISYIRESMAKMEGTMSNHDKIYAKKEELTEVIKDMEQAHNDMLKMISLKVDHTDFDPIKKLLGRINWLLISFIIMAVLAALVKIGSSTQ